VTRYPLTVAILLLSGMLPLRAQTLVTVRPQIIDSLLLNPGIGFNTSQHLDRRSSQDGHYRYYDPPLSLEQYPRTTLAYLRFEWRYLEPEPGIYNWYIIDDALKLAVGRGQTLAFRVVPYSNGPGRDIPDWLRAEIGASDSLPHSFWRVKHSEPQYIQAMTRLAAALGERYDGNPDIEFVDAGIVGFWGEGAGSELLPQDAREKLVDAYLDAFKKTQVVMLLTDERTNKYAMSRGNPGWRVDCLGDLGFWAAEQNGWTHMYDYYPESIVNFGVAEAWKTAPVVFETCGAMISWKNHEHYDSTQVAYILDQALKWHISILNDKSTPVPPEWRPMVDNWLKRVGYRLALRKFSFPETVRPHGKLTFSSWWENQGVAPCYRDWPVALRLTGKTHTLVLPTDSDIRKWLPGDAVFDSAVFLPADIPEGIYELSIGILDPRTGKTGIRLAVAGRDAEGWYRLGEIHVER
jgi:hypothetical protein